MTWHRRCSFVLDHFGNSQEIGNGWTSGHSENLGHYSAGRDSILYAYIRQSIVVPDLLVFCPGRWYTILQRVLCSPCVYVQVDIQLLPGM